MTREEFRAAVDLIGRDTHNMDTAVVTFKDGERHITPCWTIKEGEMSVQYQDVHCTPTSPLVEVPYQAIKSVHDYTEEV